jgi:hypothetical protein
MNTDTGETYTAGGDFKPDRTGIPKIEKNLADQLVNFAFPGPVLMRVCAWCQGVLGFVLLEPGPGVKSGLTHGLCPKCKEQMDAAFKRQQEAQGVPRPPVMD